MAVRRKSNQSRGTVGPLHMQLELYHFESDRAGRDVRVCVAQETSSSFSATCLSPHQHGGDAVDLPQAQGQRDGNLSVRPQLDGAHRHVLLLLLDFVQEPQESPKNSQTGDNNHPAHSTCSHLWTHNHRSHKLQRNETLLYSNCKHPRAHRIFCVVLCQ